MFKKRSIDAALIEKRGGVRAVAENTPAPAKKSGLAVYFNAILHRGAPINLESALVEKGWKVTYEDQTALLLQCPKTPCWEK